MKKVLYICFCISSIFLTACEGSATVNNNETTSVITENEEFFVEDSNDIQDLIGEANIHGNKNTNLKNGGWVAEQGDWNYYAVGSHILKENVVTGEKIEILGQFDDSENTGFNNLHVMGEWIYFSRENDGNDIRRIKIDGTCYETLWTEWSDDIIAWDTYFEKVYAKVRERISASQYRYILAEIDWDNGTYYEIADISGGESNISWNLIGVHSDYAYFYREYTRLEYQFLRVSLSDGSEFVTSWTDAYEVFAVGTPCINNGFVCFTYSWGKAWIPDSTEYYLYYSRLSEEDSKFYSISIPRSADGTFNLYNGFDIVLGGSVISKCVANQEFAEEVIVDDNTNSICIAHDKIYYKCNGIYCEINFDGTGWREIDISQYSSGS